MLLFRPDVLPEVERKPISEVSVGESFTVTVTVEDWERGIAQARPGQTSDRCALAQALRRQFRVDASVDHFTAGVYPANASSFQCSHNGCNFVTAFDARVPFPGSTVVTFTREI